MPVDQVRLGLSPRTRGENLDHIQALAEVLDNLPPIVVHRPTMLVVDGAHRWRAAKLAGRRDISVEYFDGSDEEAALLAVTLNLEHGLPLTTTDRRTTARRVLQQHPEWSDRRVARAVGLSPKTVAGIRSNGCPSDGILQPATRLGIDGRRRGVPRPRSAEHVQAAKRSRTDPSAGPFRDGLSHSPPPVGVERPDQRGGAPTFRHAADAAIVLASLRKDPSLRSSDAGRELLRLLATRGLSNDMWRRFVHAIPPHQRDNVAVLAEQISEGWRELATWLRDCLSSAQA